jgi:hypothetical protein
MTRRAELGLGVAAWLIAGCSLLPPGIVPTQIACGPVPKDRCDELAAGILRSIRAERPDRGIVRLTLTDDRGSYTAEFDDGTGQSLIID